MLISLHKQATTTPKVRAAIRASDEPAWVLAGRHGVSEQTVWKWRKLLADGGTAAVGSDEDVVGASEVRKLEARIRELERQLGRKTLEVEILKEALDKSQAKKPTLLSYSPRTGGGR